ncbi:MAG: hypothetical protein JWS10_524, partial [Cypionkella sp.]|nr:hypothetical protein [Cypionkella sp.]
NSPTTGLHPVLNLVLHSKPPANSVAGRHARNPAKPKPRGRRSVYHGRVEGSVSYGELTVQPGATVEGDLKKISPAKREDHLGGSAVL